MLLKWKALEFSFVVSKKALLSREEPHIGLSIMNSKACSHLVYTCCYAHIISPKHGSVFIACSNDFIEHVMSCKRKNHFRSHLRKVTLV